MLCAAAVQAEERSLYRQLDGEDAIAAVPDGMMATLFERASSCCIG
jgi:hypothetical protein